MTVWESAEVADEVVERVARTLMRDYFGAPNLVAAWLESGEEDKNKFRWMARNAIVEALRA